MHGSYNIVDQTLICENKRSLTHKDIVFLFEGNMFVSAEEEEHALKEIATHYQTMEVFNNLRNQFAFVIFDKNRKVLSLIRDPAGTVPLYYATEPNRFIFATSIKPILMELGKAISLNENIIHEYFMFGYISGKNTFFSGVFEVKPGSILKVDTFGRLSEEDYYHLRYSNDFDKVNSYSHELFQEAFWNSLSWQTQDKYKKNIGVLSSGGIDSSILVSGFEKVAKRRFKTYYVGFEEYENNRLVEVNALSEFCNTDHKSVLISNDEYSDNLLETIKINEEPLNHPSSIAIKWLYGQINEEIGVLLSGEGADCLYCGYFIFNLMNWFYVKNPVRFLSFPFGKILKPLFGERRGRDKVEKVLAALTLSPDEYMISYGDFTNSDKEGVGGLLKARFPITFGENYLSGFSNYSKKNVLDIILKIYQTHFLVEGLNTSSKLGNEYGIEIRYPFIDIKMIDLFNSFPWKERIEFLRRKHQIYAIANKYLPKEILNKPKEGFGVPLYSWFYDEKGLGRFIGLLSDRRTRERGVFEVNYLEKLLDEYQNRRLSDDSFEGIIWPIINFELWNRIFVDKKLVGY